MPTLEPRTLWFIGGMILLYFAVTSFPQIGVPIALITVIALAIALSKKGVL